MRICNRCGQEKPSSEFYSHPKTKDGLHPYCIVCMKKYNREYYKKHKKRIDKKVVNWRKENPDKVREWNRQYRERHPEEIRESRRKSQRKYGRNNKELLTERKREWRKENRDKNRARELLQYAIRKGMIIRPEICSECGKKKKWIDGHHEDYSKPLEVDWLCRRCHKKREKME